MEYFNLEQTIKEIFPLNYQEIQQKSQLQVVEIEYLQNELQNLNKQLKTIQTFMNTHKSLIHFTLEFNQEQEEKYFELK